MLYNIRNSKSKEKLELKVYNEMIEYVNHLSFIGILINDIFNYNYNINISKQKMYIGCRY